MTPPGLGRRGGFDKTYRGLAAVSRVKAAFVLVLAIAFAGCLGGEARTEWAYADTQLAALADDGRTGRGVTVAILDTGINLGHPALSHLKDGKHDNGELVAFRDYLTNKEGIGAAVDEDGHGTHVLGVISARGSSFMDKLAYGGVDLRGGAPNVRLVVARVCGADGCLAEALPRAVEWAVDQGADVLSLSLGGERAPSLLGSQRDQLSSAVNAAIDRGVVVVASAGNEGTAHGDVSAPADVPGVIAVGAVDKSGAVWEGSSRGAPTDCRSVPLVGSQGRCPPHQKPELVAPGVDILGPWSGTSYVRATGTSQACPFVTAAVALILEGRQDLGNREAVMEVKRALVESAKPTSGQDLPHDTASGYGLLQAKAALNAYRT